MDKTMAGNKCGTSLNIRALKFWGLSCSTTTSKMELEKFVKGIIYVTVILNQ